MKIKNLVLPIILICAALNSYAMQQPIKQKPVGATYVVIAEPALTVPWSRNALTTHLALRRMSDNAEIHLYKVGEGKAAYYVGNIHPAEDISEGVVHLPSIGAGGDIASYENPVKELDPIEAERLYNQFASKTSIR